MYHSYYDLAGGDDSKSVLFNLSDLGMEDMMVKFEVFYEATRFLLTSDDADTETIGSGLFEAIVQHFVDHGFGPGLLKNPEINFLVGKLIFFRFDILEEFDLIVGAFENEFVNPYASYRLIQLVLKWWT